MFKLVFLFLAVLTASLIQADTASIKDDLGQIPLNQDSSDALDYLNFDGESANIPPPLEATQSKLQ